AGTANRGLFLLRVTWRTSPDAGARGTDDRDALSSSSDQAVVVVGVGNKKARGPGTPPTGPLAASQQCEPWRAEDVRRFMRTFSSYGGMGRSRKCLAGGRFHLARPRRRRGTRVRPSPRGKGSAHPHSFGQHGPSFIRLRSPSSTVSYGV